MSAQEKVNKRNITTLSTEMQANRDRISVLEEGNHRLANALAALQADLINTKQMAAHLSRVGRGPTA